MSAKKKVAIIGTVGIPACYGGFETLAEHLVEHTSNEHDMTVYCSGKKYPAAERKEFYKGSRLIYLPFDANGIQSIIYDSLSILHAIFRSDVLLVLGVAGAWLFPFVRLFTSKKIIVSIDGIEWKRDKWSTLAKWYLWWAEGLAVKFSHLDISDNESIQDYTAERYGTLSNIIEYGADHTMRVFPESQDRRQYSFLSSAYAFKVCRIEPENNVHTVLEAFAEMPKYTFVMVGNWDKSEYGQKLKALYSTHKNLHLLDPIYNQRELDLIRSNAMVYIHGHSAGGTNPSLVEAMYLGLPIIAFGVSYNRTTTDHKAYYFQTKEELQELVLNTSVRSFHESGAVMKNIADQRYTWKIVAEKYSYLVKKALGNEAKPQVAPSARLVADQSLLQEDLAHLAHQRLFFES